jgi:hypothetical protein
MRYRDIPEPDSDPPEDAYTVADGCGHEVYVGETLVEWHDGRRYVFLCEECFRERLSALTVEELARQFGSTCRTVTV